MKERVGSAERASILVFLPLDCVGNVIYCMTCNILQIRAGARTNVGNIEEKRRTLASGVALEECLHLCCYVHS